MHEVDMTKVPAAAPLPRSGSGKQRTPHPLRLACATSEWVIHLRRTTPPCLHLAARAGPPGVGSKASLRSPNRACAPAAGLLPPRIICLFFFLSPGLSGLFRFPPAAIGQWKEISAARELRICSCPITSLSPLSASASVFKVPPPFLDPLHMLSRRHITRPQLDGRPPPASPRPIKQPLRRFDAWQLLCLKRDEAVPAPGKTSPAGGHELTALAPPAWPSR